MIGRRHLYKQPSHISGCSTYNMEQYELSDDRVVLVDKLEEEYVVTLKQKDADDKCVVFTTNR